MATAHQLYTPERLKDMDDAQLTSVEKFALADAAETAHTTVYAEMDRADTIATALRTVRDIAAERGRRAAAKRGEAFLRKNFGKGTTQL